MDELIEFDRETLDRLIVNTQVVCLSPKNVMSFWIKKQNRDRETIWVGDNSTLFPYELMRQFKIYSIYQSDILFENLKQQAIEAFNPLTLRNQELPTQGDSNEQHQGDSAQQEDHHHCWRCCRCRACRIRRPKGATHHNAGYQHTAGCLIQPVHPYRF